MWSSSDLYAIFGKVNSETIEHLFVWFCPVITTFWKNINEYLKDNCNFTINLNLTTVCLGYTGIVNGRLINHLINIIKRYIYVIKCEEGQICINAVMLQIRNTYLIEKNIVELKHGNKIIFDD